MMCQCGKTISGDWDFCPGCGADTDGKSLESLLRHLQRNAIAKRKILSGYNDRYVVESGGVENLSPSRKLELSRRNKTLEKWQSWADKLAELLGSQS